MLLDSLEVALELEDAMEADVVVLRSVEMLLEIVSVAEPVSGVLSQGGMAIPHFARLALAFGVE